MTASSPSQQHLERTGVSGDGYWGWYVCFNGENLSPYLEDLCLLQEIRCPPPAEWLLTCGPA